MAVNTRDEIRSLIKDNPMCIRDIADKLGQSRQSVNMMMIKLNKAKEVDVIPMRMHGSGYKDINYYKLREVNPNIRRIEFNTSYYQNKFREQLKLTHLDKEIAIRKMGAISVGGVELV